MHWINFPLLTIMIWSGMLIYWANDVYSIKVGNTTIFKFFPESFYKALNIPYRLADGMAFHFSFMWLFMINGLLYVLYTGLSGEWRYLIPSKKIMERGLVSCTTRFEVTKTSTTAIKI